MPTMVRRRFQVEVQEGEYSLDVSVICSERIGSGWVWVDNMPGITLLPTSETERRAVLKDALIALIEHL